MQVFCCRDRLSRLSFWFIFESSYIILTRLQSFLRYFNTIIKLLERLNQFLANFQYASYDSFLIVEFAILYLGLDSFMFGRRLGARYNPAFEGGGSAPLQQINGSHLSAGGEARQPLSELGYGFLGEPVTKSTSDEKTWSSHIFLYMLLYVRTNRETIRRHIIDTFASQVLSSLLSCLLLVNSFQ